MKYNFVLFSSTFSPYKYMYKEIVNLDNVKIFWHQNDMLQMLSWVGRKVSHYYLHPKINKIMNLPCKKSWYYHALKKLKFKEDLPICFIWHYNFYKDIEEGMLDYLKKIYPTSKHVFAFSDPIYMNEEVVAKLKQKVDIVSVFDPTIAQKYGIHFFPNVFPDIEEKNTSFEYDLCFIGADRGREKDVIEIAKACKENNVKARFIVHPKDYEKKDLNNDLGIEYIKTKYPYDEMVKIANQSRCLLELKIDPFNTCSLRVQEAVVLGKKIITNNRNVLEMPCCKDSEWVFYYQHPDEIEWSRMLSDALVDYHYKGEYSATGWLVNIQRELEKTSETRIH